MAIETLLFEDAFFCYLSLPECAGDFSCSDSKVKKPNVLVPQRFCPGAEKLASFQIVPFTCGYNTWPGQYRRWFSFELTKSPCMREAVYFHLVVQLCLASMLWRLIQK